MFGRIILKPEIGREAVYDNVYSLDGRWQSFVCCNCNAPVPLDIEKYIGRPASPESVLEPSDGQLIREHFGILKRSLENGAAKVRVESCKKCGALFLVYVAEFEPRYGWCQGILQGITELASSNKPFRADA